MADQLLEDEARLVETARAIEISQALFDPVGDRHLGVGVAQFEERAQALGLVDIKVLLGGQQQAPSSIQRIISPAPMSLLLSLDPAADVIEAAIGQGYGMKGVDNLLGLGQDNRVHGGVFVGHIQGSELDPLLPTWGLFVKPFGNLGVLAAGQDLDDLVVFDVRHRGRVVALSL